MPNDRRRNDRGLLNYYAPLAFTVTVAAIGIAAWIYKERNDAHDEDEWDGKGNGGRGDYPPPAPDYNSNVPPGHTSYAPEAAGGPPTSSDDPNVFARMQGALRRTPSPQQIFDGASRKVAAGMAAAGAMVGGALSSIREEEGGHYADHSRWSEEAEARRHEQAAASLQTASMPPQVPSLQRGGPATRKTVAIVLSAEAAQHEADHDAFHTEHASILSHLPEHIGADSRVFILVYAPGLKQHPQHSTSTRPPPSIASSYSHIDQTDLQTPGEEHDKPLTTLDPFPASSQSFSPDNTLDTTSASPMFRALYQQAQALVERDAMIMPFTTPTGYVHLVRHITPNTVYVQSNLSGPGGEAVKHISGWVGEVVLVVGDESGHGGLVDSEDERGGDDRDRDLWWQSDPAVGLGKGIDVVEGLRIGEDWRRRVRMHD